MSNSGSIRLQRQLSLKTVAKAVRGFIPQEVDIGDLKKENIDDFFKRYAILDGQVINGRIHKDRFRRLHALLAVFAMLTNCILMLILFFSSDEIQVAFGDYFYVSGSSKNYLRSAQFLACITGIIIKLDFMAKDKSSDDYSWLQMHHIIFDNSLLGKYLIDKKDFARWFQVSTMLKQNVQSAAISFTVGCIGIGGLTLFILPGYNPWLTGIHYFIAVCSAYYFISTNITVNYLATSTSLAVTYRLRGIKRRIKEIQSSFTNESLDAEVIDKRIRRVLQHIGLTLKDLKDYNRFLRTSVGTLVTTSFATTLLSLYAVVFEEMSIVFYFVFGIGFFASFLNTVVIGIPAAHLSSMLEATSNRLASLIKERVSNKTRLKVLNYMMYLGDGKRQGLTVFTLFVFTYQICFESILELGNYFMLLVIVRKA